MKDILNIKDIITAIKSEKKFILLLIFITFLVYVNAIRGEFVTADDIPGIVENPLTKDLAGSLQTLNISAIKNALIYQVAGMNSHVFHLVSILIHLINIVLVFAFARTLFNDKVAKIATAIFALHPVNVETVVWISGIPYAINSIFALIVLTLFVLFKKTKLIKYFILSIAVYVLMVINDKGAWALVVPFVILIIDQFLFSEKLNIKNALISMTPFLIIAGISAYIIVGKNYSGRMEALTSQYYFDPTQAPPLLNRIPFTMYMGIKNLVIPYELNIYPGEKEITMTEYRLTLILTWAFVILAIYLWKNNRVYAGLLFAVLASLGPTFSPVQVAWLMTERYMYLSSVFFALLVGLIATNTNISKRQIKKADMIIVGILILFAIRIILRTEDWRTNKNLWLSTLVFSPESYRVYNNLGDVYIKENNFDKAIESFKRSFELFPQYADAMHNLAIVYMYQKDTENAKKYMQMAIDTKPTLVPAWEKMGLIYLQEKQYDVAQVYFMEALKLNPNAQLAQQGLKTIQEEKATLGIQ